MKTLLRLDHLRHEVRILGPSLFLIPLALAAVFAGLTVMLFVGNEVVSSSREAAKLVTILPESPAALVCSRLFRFLVLSTSANPEESRIG